MNSPTDIDDEMEAVCSDIRKLDPQSIRTAQVLRNTLDQLYDGQRTGRYRWDQLFKTEKTHCGTLVEINLHREFSFQNGINLDYRIAGVEVDCKYSQSLNSWMIPPEAHGHLCLLIWAEDQSSRWSMGIVRASPNCLNIGTNRDNKATLNAAGRSAIRWIFREQSLPPNILLQLDREIVDRIMQMRSGQKRINELFRNTLGMRVGRGVISTVAQQADYMKRVRGNGGARTALLPEGIVILGQYKSHCAIARQLGASEPGPGESIPLRLAPAKVGDPRTVHIDGRAWRVAMDRDPHVRAPKLPRI